MSISSKTLDSIQAAGAAAFAAHAELQISVGDFSEQVKAAVLNNAFDMGNDTLFEEWKTLARLTQAVAQIEAELRKVYSVAAAISGNQSKTVPTVPALSAPTLTQGQELEMVTPIGATDVRVKRTGAKAAHSPKRKSKTRPLRGNTAKVLEQLLKKLNNEDFVEVNRSALAGEVGIPKGSIAASINKLLETGHIVVGPKGQLKLST
jgi:hypothetical protein